VRKKCAAVRRRLGDERGSYLVEACVAMFVMAVAVTGIVGSMGSGLGLVGHSRQRSSGVHVAQERLERVHSIPYARVATYEAPAHNSDPKNPDHNVSSDGSTYTVGGIAEPLVVDSVDGALKHIDDPFTQPGLSTKFSVYQYVTWVDDPDLDTPSQHDYKRVIVVVTWKFPVQGGPSHTVTQSTFLSDGSVTVPMPTPTPTPGPASPTPVPTEAPTAEPGTCPGDVSAPSGGMELLSGAGAQQGYTNSTTVQVRLTATDPCAPISGELSNDGVTFTPVSTLETGVATTIAWTIPPGDGMKSVHVRFRDGVGNTSGVLATTIVLDQTAPTIPGNLRTSSCSIQGNDRTITMTWNASDTGSSNFLGYRVYKSLEQAAYASLLTTGSQSATNTDSKSYGSLRFIVRAYDRAGNESGDSNELTFSKNNC
jgi:Tfp pilus assembly protein PilV